MKRIISSFLTLVLVLGLCACGQTATVEGEQNVPTWQEQYDLGIRYLSEGNYEEAIIAFTAAIEIDPKRAPAYVGRGDAHNGVAQLAVGDVTEPSELPEKAINSYESSIADYLAALDLDATVSEVYLKAAEVYLALGDTESAIDILTRGIEATDDERLADKLAEIEPGQLQIGGNGMIMYSGSGRNMTMSLIYPDLPESVLVSEVDNSEGGHVLDAVFSVSFSDGEQTFCVWTQVHDNDSDHAYMTAIPNSAACSHVLSVAFYNSENPESMFWEHLEENPVVVTRSGSTLTWNFTVPNAGFSVSDIRYVGYSLYYKRSEDNKSYEQATFMVENGTLSYLNDGCVEDLGFLISRTDYDLLYR